MDPVSGLSAFLATLGPWGIVVGALLPIALRLLGVKIPVPFTPKAPDAPGPSPLPSPVSPGLDRFPLLNALLRALLGVKAPAAENASREWLEGVHKEIGMILEGKAK